MLQLIQIQAIHLRKGDKIFDFKTRKAHTIDYVGFINPKNDGCTSSVISVVVDYGIEALTSDSFEPHDKVLILIDTASIEIVPIQS